MLQLVSLLDSLLGPPGDVEDPEEALWEPEILVGLCDFVLE